MKTGFGLFRNYGWKKNLLAAGACFLFLLLLEKSSSLLSAFRLLSVFDPSIAVMPLLGFMLGIWGVAGCVLKHVCDMFLMIRDIGFAEIGFICRYFILSTLAMMVYCALPAALWYLVPIKGEQRSYYPRLDTSAHVIKYYIIMAINVAVLVFFSMLNTGGVPDRAFFLNAAAAFTQYLDVVLIFGMPLIILESVIRNKTFTINERMVLAFLAVGAAASLLGAYLVYRTAWHLEPELFSNYDYAVSPDTMEVTDEMFSAVSRYYAFWNWFYIIVAVLLNGLLILEMFLMRMIEKKVTHPILHLSDALEQYKRHTEGSLHSETVTKQCMPYRYGYGEVSSLTRTCVEMVNEIDRYTENLKEATAEKERIGTELDVASKIQRDMLPGIFPPFPDRHEIDLYASMTPAKEVGGDFYDFYFTDQDHLVLTIADVSGKGIPASLFMVISKTLLKNNAQTGGSPKEILTYVNHQLCQNNDSYMFCTVWLGILDLKSGKLTAANAGHEYPALRRHGKNYELDIRKHEPPLGVIDGMRFHEYEITLERGDSLFVYTDGVSEAIDRSSQMFGEERMKKVLNEDPEKKPEELIRRVYKEIQSFAGGAPQFDDITMLSLKYLGSGSADEDRYVSFTVPAKVEKLDDVTRFLQERLEASDCPPKDLFSVSLAAEEVFVNIAQYAYEGSEGEAVVLYAFDDGTKTAEIIFIDSGMPFDPTVQAAPDITQRPEERQIGGLGIHIVKKTMDEVSYRYEGGKNILTMKKIFR